MYGAYTCIPHIGVPLARYIALAAYGYVQGQQMTGIWVRLMSSVFHLSIIE